MAGTSSNIPYRIDRLPWSRWHWLVVIGLGITWILDGLEVSVVGSLGPTLQRSDTLGISAQQVGVAASLYLTGAVIGSLVFGELTDRLGRKKLFLVTLGWYVLFTVLTALSFNFWTFAVCRFLTGMGIGGEYSSINSTIDELIPARRRGVTDLAINGTWWAGTLLASGETVVLLNPHIVPTAIGWRLAFGVGAILAFAVLFLRTHLPESPRWLLAHGKPEEAERVVAEIEKKVSDEKGPLPKPGDATVDFSEPQGAGLVVVARTMLRDHPKRTILSLVLMITQAFLYNAVTFTQALVLTTFFSVPPPDVGLYLIPFAFGNLLGPLLLGHFFDAIGRKKMIAGTFFLSATLLTITSVLFARHALDARQITIAWSVIFFFASAGASSAYLTVSEIFPLETRAMAIAIVYSVGTLVGGALAPVLFGALIATKDAGHVAVGYLIGAAMMYVGGATELVLGIDAEGKSLEEIAAPISSGGGQKQGAAA